MKNNSIMGMVIEHVKKNSEMSGKEIKQYIVKALGAKASSVGPILARATQYGYLEVIEKKIIEGKVWRVYK